MYSDEAGAQASPGMLDSFYCYKASDTAAELEKRYQIRFLEESHVIQAHSDRGDFRNLQIWNGDRPDPEWSGGASGGRRLYFPDPVRVCPRQNYYNAQDDRTAGIVPYYLSEGQSGRESVSKVYRYSSVSEQAQIADDVCYPGGRGTEDNVPGVWYQDGVAAMQGSQMAYDGHYAPMLVPYSVVRGRKVARTVLAMPTSASATGFTPQDSDWKNWIQKPMKISCMTEPCSAFTRQSGMIQRTEKEKSSFMKKIHRSLAQRNF